MARNCTGYSELFLVFLMIFLLFALVVEIFLAIYLNKIKGLVANGDITYLSPTDAQNYFIMTCIVAGLTLLFLVVTLIYIFRRSACPVSYETTEVSEGMEEVQAATVSAYPSLYPSPSPYPYMPIAQQQPQQPFVVSRRLSATNINDAGLYAGFDSIYLNDL